MQLLKMIVILLLSGCGSLFAHEEDRPLSHIEGVVEFVNSQRAQINLNNEYQPKDIVLVFPYISGGIFGSPTSEPLFVKRIDATLHFALELNDKSEAIEKGSRPLSNKWKELGLMVKPASTRIARLGTFPYSWETKKTLGGGGFIAPESRNYLILLYVDRACEISGQFQLDGDSYSHELKLPSRGFHWIEREEKSSSHYHFHNHSGNTATFMISMPSGEEL